MAQVDVVLAEIEPLLALQAAELADPSLAAKARAAFRHFLALLEVGALRAASRGEDGRWTVDPRVKNGILFGFRLGRLVEMGDAALPFVDKDTYPVRAFPPDARVRVVPGGTSVRRGCHLAPSVTVMP